MPASRGEGEMAKATKVDRKAKAFDDELERTIKRVWFLVEQRYQYNFDDCQIPGFVIEEVADVGARRGYRQKDFKRIEDFARDGVVMRAEGRLGEYRETWASLEPVEESIHDGLVKGPIERLGFRTPSIRCGTSASTRLMGVWNCRLIRIVLVPAT
jgi:hypothetical protein